MDTLQAALERVLSELPDDEWTALSVRVRGPRCAQPARRRRKSRATTQVEAIAP